MIKLSTTQQKVLAIYHNEGHVKAWNYWKLMGNTYGIFLGEVPSNDFIDGKSLANHIGLTEGVLCNNDTPWLKFLLDGNFIYVPVKPLMHSVSHEAINVCGAVFENEGATINIGGNVYDITLLRGLNENYNPNKDYYGFDDVNTHSSEWNRLMYPIHSGVHTDSDNPIIGSVPYGLWASYSDLLVHYKCGDGSGTWSQEVIDDEFRPVRGYVGVTHVDNVSATSTTSHLGWRPALRFSV